MNNGYSYPDDVVLDAFWEYNHVKFYTKSAIPANIVKQTLGTFPRRLYVDIEYQCQECRRWFLFFALEQKYWYEELGFYIDSHPTLCMECRVKKKRTKDSKLAEITRANEDV